MLESVGVRDWSMRLAIPPFRLGEALVPAAWGWALLVVSVTFWKIWEIPARLPDINEVATTHLFLFPVSLALFFLLSWIRQYYDDEQAHPGPRPFVRWRATVGIWMLALLHPVSCALYPAVFNLDDRTDIAEMPLRPARGDLAHQIDVEAFIDHAEKSEHRSVETETLIGNAAYLRHTWHPSTRPKRLVLDPAQRWTRLVVLGVRGGGLLDTAGTVEFRAGYVREGRPGTVVETSQFVRDGGRWVYLAAVSP